MPQHHDRAMDVRTKRHTVNASAAVFAALTLGGSLLAAGVWGQTATPSAEAEAQMRELLDVLERAEAEANASAGRPAFEADLQQRRAAKEARRQAALDARRAARQEIAARPEPISLQDMARQRDVPRPQATAQAPATVTRIVVPSDAPTALAAPVAAPTVEAAMPTPSPAAAKVGATAIADIDVSFKLVAGVAKPGHADGAWVAPPIHSGYQEGAFTVEAKVRARDAKGRPVEVNPEWSSGAPSVQVSPSHGAAVKITVRAAGESNVTMTAMGFSKDLWISAVNQGKTIKVRISD